jgi:hypothetical protein
MTKAWALGLAVLSGLCGVLNAQQNDGMNALDVANRTSSAPVASLGLSDSHHFPFRSAFAWMEPANDFLPNWKPDGWDSAPDYKVATNSRQRRQKANDYKNVSDSKDSTGASIEMRKSLFDNIHGEVGFLYGASTGGRVSHQLESTYIFGSVGDEHVQISAGAFYEHSNTDFSRRGR